MGSTRTKNARPIRLSAETIARRGSRPPAASSPERERFGCNRVDRLRSFASLAKEAWIGRRKSGLFRRDPNARQHFSGASEVASCQRRRRWWSEHSAVCGSASRRARSFWPQAMRPSARRRWRRSPAGAARWGPHEYEHIKRARGEARAAHGRALGQVFEHLKQSWRQVRAHRW